MIYETSAERFLRVLNATPAEVDAYNLASHPNPTVYLARLLRQRHPRMSHLWEAIECPYCHAAVGEPCQRKGGGTADVSHQARIWDFKQGAPS